jgi:hypothetical protein
MTNRDDWDDGTVNHAASKEWNSGVDCDPLEAARAVVVACDLYAAWDGRHPSKHPVPHEIRAAVERLKGALDA